MTMIQTACVLWSGVLLRTMSQPLAFVNEGLWHCVVFKVLFISNTTTWNRKKNHTVVRIKDIFGERNCSIYIFFIIIIYGNKESPWCLLARSAVPAATTCGRRVHIKLQHLCGDFLSQFVVDPLPIHQLLVSPSLLNSPFTNHNNLICPLNRLQPVSNHQQGFVGTLSNSLLNLCQGQ